MHLQKLWILINIWASISVQMQSGISRLTSMINKCAKMCFSNSLPVDLNSLIYGNDTLTDTQNEILFGIVQNYIKETKRFV